jgi:hypothetical protein
MRGARVLTCLLIVGGIAAASGASAGPGTSMSGARLGDPVIAAAGDIVCAPSNAAFGGSDPARCQHRATARLISDRGVDAVLPLGDDQYENGTLSEYQGGYDPSWGVFNDVAHPAVGNHEYQTPGAAGYFDYFQLVGVEVGARTEGYYSLDIGTWHLIALNSNCGAVRCGATSAQVAWLRADLAGTTQPCVLAYWHHPRFSSGLHGDIANVKPFWTELYRARADVVLNGHDHDYERFKLQDPSGRATTTGIREFVVGTGGRSLYNFSTIDANSVKRVKSFGVLFLTLHPDGYDWRFVNTAGTIADSGSRACH